MKQDMMGWHRQTICTSLQTDNHASTSSRNFLQAGPLPDIRALKAMMGTYIYMTDVLFDCSSYLPI